MFAVKTNKVSWFEGDGAVAIAAVPISSSPVQHFLVKAESILSSLRHSC